MTDDTEEMMLNYQWFEIYRTFQIVLNCHIRKVLFWIPDADIDAEIEAMEWEEYLERDLFEEFIREELSKGLREALDKGIDDFIFGRTTAEEVRNAEGFGDPDDRAGFGGTSDRREERIITGESPIWWCG